MFGKKREPDIIGIMYKPRHMQSIIADLSNARDGGFLGSGDGPYYCNCGRRFRINKFYAGDEIVVMHYPKEGVFKPYEKVKALGTEFAIVENKLHHINTFYYLDVERENGEVVRMRPPFTVAPVQDYRHFWNLVDGWDHSVNGNLEGRCPVY